MRQRTAEPAEPAEHSEHSEHSGRAFTRENAGEMARRATRAREAKRAAAKLGVSIAELNNGDSPILSLSKTRILEALRAGVDLDPKTLASLIQAAVRLSPAPKTDERPEELDELARRYRAAGFELPFF